MQILSNQLKGSKQEPDNSSYQSFARNAGFTFYIIYSIIGQLMRRVLQAFMVAIFRQTRLLMCSSVQ